MSDLNPRLGFESFIVGASNQTAADAARAVAESPGTLYNPLFIYGNTGLGKTHLLQAIGLHARAIGTAPEVEFLTLEEFFELLHAASAAGQVEAFRHRYGGVNILLIDDIQFLSSRREAQAELLHIAGDMKAAGLQLVVTSDQAPGDIANLDPRLGAELSSGLTIDVTRPDYYVRLGILQRRAEERGAEFAPAVLEAAAQIEVSNVRELIGALNRLVAFQAVSETPVTPEAATSMLTDLVVAPASPTAAPEVEVVQDLASVMDPNVSLAELAPLSSTNDDIIKGDMALMPDPPVMPQFSQPVPRRPAPPARPSIARPSLGRPVTSRPSSAQPATPAPPPVSPPARARPTLPRVVAPVSPSATGDEFAQFLSGVETTVKRTVEAWKAMVGEAILRFEGQGFETTRLGTLLDEGNQRAAEDTVRQFEQDVEQLRTYERELAALDPAAATSYVFKDPDRVREAAALLERARESVAPPLGPTGAWAFDGFRVGDSNQLAYQTALAVVESPGQRYNPLVLVGPPGLGKTHLLQSIGHALAAVPGALVACLSAQDYVDELSQAEDGGRLEQWRSRYRRASAYLLDDVHLLANKSRAQEELFNLFNHMTEAGRQLVFTSTEMPAKVDGLEPRIVSRLEGGFIANVDRPDPALRIDLATKQLADKLGTVDAELAEYLGSRPADSYRALAAALQRVVRAAEAEGVPPSVTLAREVLESEAPPIAAPAAGVRTSGINVAPLAVVRSREKVVWRWPETGDRVIEEL